MSAINAWANPPSGRNGQTFDSPTFTGPRTGMSYPLAMSGTAANVPADTTEDALATITIPANTLRAGDALHIVTVWSWTSSANNKTPRIRLGGASGTQYLNAAFTTTSGFAHEMTIWARTTGSQVGAPNNTAVWGASTNAPTTSSVDLTASTTLVLSGQKASSGETMTLEAYLVEVIRA